MQSEINSKIQKSQNILLRALLRPNNSQSNSQLGFSIIQLIVILLFLGVLVAVTLPNLLLTCDPSRAREVEGKNGVSTINRAQEVYHYEAEVFVTSLSDSDLKSVNPLGVVLEPIFYKLSVSSSNPSYTATATAIVIDTDKYGFRNYQSAIAYGNDKYATVVCQSVEIGGSVLAQVTGGANIDPSASCSTGINLN